MMSGIVGFSLRTGAAAVGPCTCMYIAKEGRIGVSDPVVNEKLLVIMRWRRLVSRATGAELRLAHILGAC
jgi:hypothetical protein